MAAPIVVLDVPVETVTDDDFELDLRVVEATTRSRSRLPPGWPTIGEWRPARASTPRGAAATALPPA